MMIMLDPGRDPAQRQQFRDWCFRHGVLASDVLGPIWVDLAARTVVVTAAMPEPVPGDPDFPEHRRDEQNNVLTERRVLPLVDAPPAWMLARDERSGTAA